MHVQVGKQIRSHGSVLPDALLKRPPHCVTKCCRFEVSLWPRNNGTLLKSGSKLAEPNHLRLAAHIGV